MLHRRLVLRAEHGNVERQADHLVAERPAAHEAVRRGEILAGPRLQTEQRPVEEHRLVEGVERLRQGDVVDREHRDRGGQGVAERDEVREPFPVVACEEHRRPVGRSDRCEVRLAGAAPPGEHRGEQRLRAPHRVVRVRALDGECRDAVAVRVAVVEQDTGSAAVPALHRLGPMRADVAEAEGIEDRSASSAEPGPTASSANA